jgi:hypothetical protein
MANIYFGDGYSAVDGNWNNASNWYLTPASFTCIPCSCPTYGPGTAAGRVPATGDSVVILAHVTTGPTGGWAGNMTVAVQNPRATTGNIGAGNYTGTVALNSATISGGTFSNTITGSGGTISGGTFNGAVAGALIFSGGTFNGSTSGLGGCAFNGGSFSNPISAGAGSAFSFSTNQNITVSVVPANGCSFSSGTYGGNITINRTGSGTSPIPVSISGGTYNGVLSFSGPGTQTGTMTVTFSGSAVINSTLPVVSSRMAYAVSGTGASYNPPAVQTSAIKSGNYMTFSASAIPADPGFKIVGSSFNPVIALTGTSNDILGAGLL